MSSIAFSHTSSLLSTKRALRAMMLLLVKLHLKSSIYQLMKNFRGSAMNKAGSQNILLQEQFGDQQWLSQHGGKVITKWLRKQNINIWSLWTGNSPDPHHQSSRRVKKKTAKNEILTNSNCCLCRNGLPSVRMWPRSWWAAWKNRVNTSKYKLFA